MTLRERIRTAPEPFEPENAADVFASFDASCFTEAQERLIRGIACCSPYLSTLLVRESDWMRGVWDSPPEQAINELLAWTEAGPAAGGDMARHLRIAKRRAALLIALCDLGGVWDLLTITNSLTRIADAALNTGLRHLMRRHFENGKLSGLTSEDVDAFAGLFVLAMGKMGAGELNYSSDIDLIVVSDSSVLPEDEVPELRSVFVRIIRQLVRLLSDTTRDGYVFRTDLRLRPNPSTTPVCVSADAALRYYESTGRTWERAAMIKARPAAGDLAAGRRFLEQLTPFIWRRHLDFRTVDATHEMQAQILRHKRLAGEVRLESHNMKLGLGGIRQIEFFAQTLQLITGGRDPEVREPGTVGALRVLAQKGWVPPDTADVLIDAYRHHRTIEHRLQMVRDNQTQTMPADEHGVARIAAFCGHATVKEFRETVCSRLEAVHDVCQKFFERSSGGDDDDCAIDERLLEASEQWTNLPVLRSETALHVFERVRPEILRRLGAASNPEQAVARFDEFLGGLPSGIQLFSLFETNPPLLDLLVDVCSNAPSLASYLAKNAAVLDALLDPSFFEPLEDEQSLFEDLAILLATTPDYEARLNAARIWMHKKHFQIGVLQLRGIAGVLESAQSYSDLAVACVRALLPGVEREFASRYGTVDGKGIAVLAMGKLGSSEMTATSDLDLVVVYDAAGQEQSSGPKSLHVTTYFARLTQALVTALSSRMTEGMLYNVDMRLRPSGRQGPVATSFAAFDTYQKTKAWTWEHLALSRARVIAGDPEVMRAVESVREQVILNKRDVASVLSDVVEMRERLADSRSGNETWNVKSRAGGVLDIELLAQALALASGSTRRHPKSQLDAAASSGWLGPDDLARLGATHDLLIQVQHVQRLLGEEQFDVDRLGAGGLSVLLAATARESVEELEQDLRAGTAECDAIISRLLERG